MGSLARHRVASSANPPGLDWQPIDSIEYSRYGILTLWLAAFICYVHLSATRDVLFRN
jgi:hypothetical protein